MHTCKLQNPNRVCASLFHKTVQAKTLLTAKDEQKLRSPARDMKMKIKNIVCAKPKNSVRKT